MKWLLTGLLSATLAILLYAVYPRSPCERTLAYGLGDVDPRFGVPESQVLAAARDGAGLWEDAVGAPLFRYDPSAPFKIYLHYDERQPAALEARRQKERIESDGAQLQDIHGRYEALRIAYDSEGKAYEQAVADWKASGRPAERVPILEFRRHELNSMAEQLNFMVGQLNPAAASLRSEVDDLNAKAGRAFDRGDFTGTRIDVYQFDDQKDLTLIFAHEFGHALSIEHVPDPKAVMYYSRNDQNFKELALTDSDKKGLALACSQLSLVDPRTVSRWRDRLRRRRF